MPAIANYEKTHQVLLEFVVWVDSDMKPSIQNVVELKKINPPGLKNPVLLFVVPRAMNYVVERFAVEVVQAWELLNKELKRQGRRTLGVTNKDYRHLKRIRNKLVAHKIENSLASSRHETWYRKTYGNFETVLALIARVAERVADRIHRLEARGELWTKSLRARAVTPIVLADVQALLVALKAHAIY
jgi:hypothetical protein